MMMQRDRQSGSALVAVLLGVLTIGMLVMLLSRQIGGSINSMQTVKDNAECYELARTALEMAKLELSRNQLFAYTKYDNRSYFLPSRFEYETMLEEAELFRDGRILGRGMYAYRIIASNRGLNYNNLSSAQWHRLFEVACRMDEGPDRSALVDRILDWIDRDDFARENGAEADFYDELTPPRAIRNGPLQSFDELLLIDLITTEIIEGSELYPLEEEDGMYFGGGVRRYFSHSPDELTRNSIRYILTGNTDFLEGFELEDDSEEEEYIFSSRLPQAIYVIAEGYIPEKLPLQETFDTRAASSRESDLYNLRPLATARHIILCSFTLSGKKYKISQYRDDVDAQELRPILGAQEYTLALEEEEEQAE